MLFNSIFRSKILFIKIRYERENNEGQIFSKERFVENRKLREKLDKEEGNKDTTPYYQRIFEQTKQLFASDHLFDDNAKIEIREKQREYKDFKELVKELKKERVMQRIWTVIGVTEIIVAFLLLFARLS